MNRLIAVLLASMVTGTAPGADTASQAFGIGKKTPEEAATAIGFSALPSGTGLPVGRGGVTEGRDLYAAKCAACHGDKGEGRADFPALVGGVGSLGTDSPVLTVGSYWPTATTIFDYVFRAMPYQQAGSLTVDEVYALTAWILSANKIVPDTTVVDQDSLPKVRMPNRNGFVSDSRPD